MKKSTLPNKKELLQIHVMLDDRLKKEPLGAL